MDEKNMILLLENLKWDVGRRDKTAVSSGFLINTNGFFFYNPNKRDYIRSRLEDVNEWARLKIEKLLYEYDVELFIKTIQKLGIKHEGVIQETI